MDRAGYAKNDDDTVTRETLLEERAAVRRALFGEYRLGQSDAECIEGIKRQRGTAWNDLSEYEKEEN